MNTPELVGASGYVDRDYPNLFLPDRLWQTVFKDDIELNDRIERQTGMIEVRYHPDEESIIRFTLPFKIIGTKSNLWNTSNWGVVNLIYDESKLTEEENKIFRIFLVDAIDNDGVSEVVANESNEFRDLSYVSLSEINGIPIGRIGYADYPYERVGDIISKLQDKTNINENSYYIIHNATRVR